MSRTTLDLNNLKDFDMGKANAAFLKCLASAVRDMLDRPGDKTVRKITLQMELRPIVQQDGDVVDADVAFQIRSSLPVYRTAAKPVALDRQGRLIFNPDAPDNPRQFTIDEEIDRNAS